MLKACLEYCEKSSCLILSQLESLCGMGSSFYGHRNHFGVYAGSNGNILEIPFFSSSLIQLLVLVHTYCILSWVLPSLKVYFSLSAIRLRANVIEKLLLQQTEHVPVLSNWKSFPTCEKPWISYPFAVLTSSCQENFKFEIHDLWPSGEKLQQMEQASLEQLSLSFCTSIWCLNIHIMVQHHLYRPVCERIVHVLERRQPAGSAQAAEWYTCTQEHAKEVAETTSSCLWGDLMLLI